MVSIITRQKQAFERIELTKEVCVTLSWPRAQGQ